jgi:hypothetical protein
MLYFLTTETYSTGTITGAATVRHVSIFGLRFVHSYRYVRAFLLSATVQTPERETYRYGFHL